MHHLLFLSQPAQSEDSRPKDVKAADPKAGDSKPADAKTGDQANTGDKNGTAETQPADHAPQGGCASLMSSPAQMLIFLVPLAFFLLMSRNQNKKQREIETSLKVGDRVVTRAGAIGKVVDVGERVVKVELAPGVNVQFLKTAIDGIDAGDPKPEPKKEDSKKESDKNGEAKADKESTKKEIVASKDDSKKDDVKADKDAKKSLPAAEKD